MNSQVISVKRSSDEQIRSDETNTISIPSNQTTASNCNYHRKKHNTISEPRKSLRSRIKRSTMGFLTFALFTSLAMTIGIIIVCFTSPKASKICQMTFRRTMKSSTVSNSQPRSVNIGDLNNDNQIDILVANSGTNTIGIFLSSDNGTFVNQQTYSTGSDSRPYSIVTSDFNNDNYLDIAVANYGMNNIGIFLGYGNSTFGSQKLFSTGSSRPLFITTGDFNNDNRSDIAAVHYGTDSIGIFLGNGDGSFQMQTIYSTSYDSRPYSLAVGHFNKDNISDIAVANYGTDNIGIFMGYGNGTFANQTTYTTMHNSNPFSVAIGDFDNDNELDIVIANYGSRNIGILLGHGNGTFAAQTTYSTGSESRPQFITIGYFDGNNHLDVVVADAENDRVHIILGYGNGSFATLTTYDSITNSTPIALAVIDFDNDNQSDIVVADYGTNDVLVLSGYYSRPSARAATYFIGRDSSPTSVVIYDFNKDSILDIAVNNFNEDGILILTGTGNGTFVSGKTHSSGNNSSPTHICIADLNKDNRTDIVIADFVNSCVRVLLGQDNETFAPMMTYSTGTSSTPQFVAVDDVNNDYHLDIISANTGSGSIGVFLGYGNGNFANMQTYSTGISSTPNSVAFGDLNNDTYLDIVVCMLESVCVLLGYGNGTFEMLTVYSTSPGAFSSIVALADFNRDHHLDVVTCNKIPANFGIFLGNGDGTLGKEVTYSTGNGSLPHYVIVADFNNDHYDDIAATNFGSGEVVIFFGNGNGSFELTRTYSLSSNSNPDGIAVADLNNDKHLEIVVTLRGTGDVCVLTEYYAAEFTNQSFYPTGSARRPYSLAVGDFNDDNRSDIIVANSGTDNLDILLGFGNGSFGLKMNYLIGNGSYPQYVITGYINKDNHLDIVTANSKNNTISVIMGYGNGTFAAQTMYSTGDGSRPYAVAMGDLNNDHQQDLVVANAGTDSIGIFFGFDYAVFQGQKTYPKVNGLAPNGIVVSDFNNDNYLDIGAVYPDTNILGIFFGHEDGSFPVMTNYSTGSNSYPYLLAVDDFNNDSQMDIVVVNLNANNIAVFLGCGNGSFVIVTTNPNINNVSGPTALAVGDFNHDHLADIVVIHYATGNISILQGYGNGSFAVIVAYSTGDYSYPESAAVGDFNNDGQMDIVVANYGTHNVIVYLGYGNSTFTTSVSYPSGYRSESVWVVIGDFNNDNRSDIATANYNTQNIGIFLGYGNGTFTAVTTYSTGDGSVPQCLTTGDFNKDNKLDIAVVICGSNNLVVLFGLGDGTFLLGKAYSTGTGSYPVALAIGDFNNDTRLDIVVANYLSSNIGVFLGYGRETFAGVTKYTLADKSQPHSVAIGDLNNDGWSDIIVTNYGTDCVGILLGHGNGNLQHMITYLTGVGSAPYSVAIADFNNDNRSDIVVTNSETNNIAIFLGYGDGTFAVPSNYSTGARSRPYTVAIGDFNNDNRLDLVIANSGTNNIFLLYGYGNGSFGDPSSYTLGYEYGPYSAAVTDLNQDGWMDIVIACYDTDNIETLVKMC